MVPRRTVHLFPGQGDFSVSTLVRAVRAGGGVRSAVEEVFERIDDVAAERGLTALRPRLLGAQPPSGRELAHEPTGTAQLALFGASLAVHRALCRSYGPPTAVVGVSFGEIAALTAAGVLSVGDGARAAHDLALVLACCPGGLTLLSCSEQEAHRLLQGSGAGGAVVAVVNDDRSVVVSGPVTELARVEKSAVDTGVTAVRLRLPFSSHHPQLGSAAKAFAESLRTYARSAARCPVYSAVAGRCYRPEDDVAARLADCLIRPAVVPAVLRQVAELRPDALFEAGTGDALARSARQVLAGTAAPPVHAPPVHPPPVHPPPVHAPLAVPDFPW
ncbi:acyltransferase domain-containing protein [Streptomyces blattellae]|uniref:acyltransferase domain-containing protein n=1 Tax=Streptomyces blattellae TaxID=2569855 RepID=UPI001E2AFCF9|nr:acyltransferase domain-containing protein [Streptomyces blattellae]